MKIRFWLILWIVSGLWSQAESQNITIANPSFEGEPADATVPQGWMPCKEGTTPDILPGYWGVYSQPADGDTYMGLITRQNNTWESVGQRLTGPLEKGRCYTLSLDLAHSDTYSGYNGPIKLRVWISKVKCRKDQLIYESPLIGHTDWKTYKITFTPDAESWYILLEAFHSEEEFTYKGNILIDRMSAIHGCDRT
jgi:hypothetical protein